ncbi:hypothetical protein J3R83DRAFT_1719 [Lanmaoa asiatica]|nr:hypothetical protein J3R83DRAFT_1719 [Lanmaoa asiatica]
MMEAFTKGMEEVLRNILGNGGGLPTPRWTPRWKKMEDDAVQLEKTTEPSQHCNFILSEVHHLFKDRLRITQDLNFIMHQPADPEDVYAYEHEDGPSPNMNIVAFDLSRNSLSPWNTFILDAFHHELQLCCMHENWPVKRSENYMRETLKEHYKCLRTVWQDAQPKLTSHSAIETPLETKKYRQHITILNHTVALKTNLQADDLPAWQWLQSLIKTLGEHGISSEESSVENGVENVLCVKRMEWQRNIDRELEIINFKCIIDDDIFSAQGSQPLVRKRAPDNPETTRDVLIGLPLALYDSAWIVYLTEHQTEVLQLLQEMFPWMRVVVA